ncbi:hypothetical protein MTAT_19260 [Moorella thermoacetica]|uniref:Uncharacterized protein n=1 Tax=Neomoorella thermoacetica TaxID=1525 RepID=A0AAC9MUC5_NEOTH|nr:hypothetical protein [Moorella thermoacetica]AOQ24583.1 hypothetical protein Maut_02153 [Moorella thermoacetica]TYL12684.1 hypothetical protein MTAT_19260 [Moorella thermoacetica]
MGDDSQIEAYEYDRPGCHNWCLILFRKKGAPEIEDGYYGNVKPPSNLYEILNDIDGYSLLSSTIQVKVVLSDDYKKQISEWAKEFKADDRE